MAAQVCVVVPCFREPLDVVAQTIESALSVPLALSVTIVDDGTGRTDLDTLASDRVSVVHRGKNGGPAAALNTGIESTPTGSIVCRLDVRDSFYPEPKARQIETVLRGTIASCSPHFDPVENRVSEPPANWRRRIYTDSCFTGVTNVYHRIVWERVGTDDSYRWAEDWRFALLVEHVFGWCLFPEVTCSAGMFPGGHTDCGGDKTKHRLRDADRTRVYKLGQALAKPDAYAHLYDEKWCRKRGLVPLPKHRSGWDNRK